ncbi:hypothetical protein A4R35_01555 [Thermogemmatispora tikiterensis]|uniref:Uncharacterized protein n=1 Tax=Thermogemmatispora tikiterensis TaxID=1825093 RepID=A0A328VEK8_9CHLR|nr:hypothetical protein A4R35_01555 [Thermogemmatispora tikiterensis]
MNMKGGMRTRVTAAPLSRPTSDPASMALMPRGRESAAPVIDLPWGLRNLLQKRLKLKRFESRQAVISMPLITLDRLIIARGEKLMPATSRPKVSPMAMQSRGPMFTRILPGYRAR